VIEAEFSASLLQSSVSHDPSEIILICRFAAQETFLIITNAEIIFKKKNHKCILLINLLHPYSIK